MISRYVGGVSDAIVRVLVYLFVGGRLRDAFGVAWLELCGYWIFGASLELLRGCWGRFISGRIGQ